MTGFHFTIDGIPKGKGRPRFWNGRAVTPKETRDREEFIAWTAKNAGAKPKDGPVTLLVTFWFPYPKSTPAKKQIEGLPHLKRPDGDNCLKLLMDSLNGVAWNDDAQVHEFRVKKRYGKARTDIEVIYW